MGYNKQYVGAIWTNHAMERLGQRGLSQELAGQTFVNPDKKVPGKLTGSYEFQKRFGPSLVTVIAKPNEQNEWIILSNWIDPPLPGTADEKKKIAYHKYQKASGWGKMWMLLLKQVKYLVTGKDY